MKVETVEEFLARGGVIQKVEFGVTSHTDGLTEEQRLIKQRYHRNAGLKGGAATERKSRLKGEKI